MKVFKSRVIKALQDGIRLFEVHSSEMELRQYLYLLIDFDPYLLTAYIKLGELIEYELKQEVLARSTLSIEAIKSTDEFLFKMENYYKNT